MSVGCALAAFVILLMGSTVSQAADRPNILWVTAEDMSPTLGCYGDPFATTPHLDALANQSVRYTHAFATAPVCSPSRSCLINGLAAPSQGADPNPRGVASSVLPCVRQQVGGDVLQGRDVQRHGQGLWRQLGREREPGLRHQAPEAFDGMLRRDIQVTRLHAIGRARGPLAGDSKHACDRLLQAFGFECDDLVGFGALFRRNELPVLQHLGEEPDAGDRRLQLV